MPQRLSKKKLTKKQIIDAITIRELYHTMLDYWNARDAKAIASLYEQDAHVVGFDGSQINGREEIEAEHKKIFKNHKTDPFIGKIKELRFLSGNVLIVRAIAGMVPRGQKGRKRDINPAVNAVQTIVVKKIDGDWYISLFQNTPAKFHGRPELSKSFTREIRDLL